LSSGDESRVDNVTACDLFHVSVQALDLPLQAFPLLPEKIQQATHRSAQLRIRIFQDLRHLPTQAGRPFTKADSPLQQERPNLIDHAGPSRH
jgi:hypothetical protein